MTLPDLPARYPVPVGTKYGVWTVTRQVAVNEFEIECSSCAQLDNASRRKLESMTRSVCWYNKSPYFSVHRKTPELMERWLKNPSNRP